MYKLVKQRLAEVNERRATNHPYTVNILYIVQEKDKWQQYMYIMCLMNGSQPRWRYISIVKRMSAEERELNTQSVKMKGVRRIVRRFCDTLRYRVRPI